MLHILKKLFTRTKKKKTLADFCIPKNLDKSREVESPCGRYRLRIESFKTGKGTWNYTKGTIFSNKTKKQIAAVHRNYSGFTYSWVAQEDKVYLLTGEHYQGQTVVDCQTGEVWTTNPKDTDGWCWVSHEPSPNGKIIAVNGCYWACPYHWRFFDFSDPSVTPLPEIDCEYLDHYEGDWLEDTVFVNRELGRFCPESGVEEYDLDYEECKRLRELAKEKGDEAVWRMECIGEKIARLVDGKFEVETTIEIPDDDEEDD